MKIIVSDDHGGLRAARKDVFGGVRWQRCQFHIVQTATQHAPTVADRMTVGGLLKSGWKAPGREAAETALEIVQGMYRGKAGRFETGSGRTCRRA